MFYSDTYLPDSAELPLLQAVPLEKLLPATAQFTDLPTWTSGAPIKKTGSAAALMRPEPGRAPQLLPS